MRSAAHLSVIVVVALAGASASGATKTCVTINTSAGAPIVVRLVSATTVTDQNFLGEPNPPL